MIYDCFCYFNENEVLKIRLNELFDVVDRFIIYENGHTFTGLSKGWNFDINNFKDFQEKIIYIKSDTHIEGDAFKRQFCQRDEISKHLNDNIDDDDLIIVGDLDEIPSKESIWSIYYGIKNDRDKIYFINHRTYCNYLNLYLGMFYGTKAISGRKYLKHNSVQFFRDYWFGDDVIRNGGLGWHFSWIGGKERVKQKLKSISHYDGQLNDDQINSKINDIDNLRDTLGRPLAKVDIDLNYPKYIYDNQEKLKDLIYV